MPPTFLTLFHSHTTTPTDMACPPDDNIPQMSASFSTLPPEIREQIWLQTLRPRIIYLTPHQHFSPHSEDGFHKPFDYQWVEISVGFEYTTNASAASPAEAFAAYETSLASKNGLNRERLDPELERTGGHSSYQTSTAPPALSVCHESRAIAMARGYVLAFKSVTYRWNKRHLPSLCATSSLLGAHEKCPSERGVWVDFNHDLVMLYTRSKLKMLPAHFNLPLNIVHEWAPEDVKRIKRLGVHGPPRMILSALWGKDWGTRRYGSSWITTHQWWVGMGFDSVEEIWIDEEETSNEEATEQYLSKIVEGKSLIDHWTAPLPQVKVTRGDLDEYF